MPAGTVAQQHADRTGHDLRADLSQVQVHHLCVGAGRDDRGPDTTGRADGAKYVGRIMTIVAHHQRARAALGPDISMASLLANPGFVLKPNLYRGCGRTALERGAHQIGEVFLKVVSACASFFGCTGLGCSRVRPSAPSHSLIVFSCTSTCQRRETSSRKSAQRQRTTLCTLGSGPWITSARNSAFCSIVK